MKISSIAIAALLLSGSVAFGQACASSPSSICLVPPRASISAPTYIQTGIASTSTTTGYGPTAVAPAVAYPISTGTPYTCYPSGTTTFSAGPMTSCANVSPDTACVVNAIALLRSDIQSVRGQLIASGLEMQGYELISRLNRLMADEMLFRQQMAANPNTPGAQFLAVQLQNNAIALQNDILTFHRQLSMVPVDQRPYVATSLSTFEQTAWMPAIQQFAMYGSQFSQSAAIYRTASGNTVWLSTWQTNYQSALNNIANSPQTYASARWWSSGMMAPGSGMLVSGTMECHPTAVSPAMMTPMTAGTMGMMTPMPMTTPGMLPSTLPSTATPQAGMTQGGQVLTSPPAASDLTEEPSGTTQPRSSF